MTTPSKPPSPPTRPKGVRAVRARLADGSTTTYWYCRLTSTRLPAPEDPGFEAALTAARQVRAARHADGSLGQLIERWKASPEYLATADGTREYRERYLRMVETPAWASRQASALTRSELLDLRDKMAAAHGPASANLMLRTISVMLSWAVDRGRMPFNPLARVRALPGGHLLAWAETEARIASTKFTEPVRRAVVLAYHLGQRRGDLITLTWAAYDGEAIRLQPQKTRKVREAKGLGPLRLPVGPDLRQELDAWRAENAKKAKPSATILVSGAGVPWTGAAVSLAVMREVRRLGLRDGLNLHGFRKLAATRLAEAGATTHEIAAALGWDSLAHVELYTRSANQERLAEAAVLRLENRLAKTVK